MSEAPIKYITVKASIPVETAERVKSAGFGKFSTGLIVLLSELDRLRGTIEKQESTEAAKGVRTSEFKEDTRLKRKSGEHPATYNKRVSEYVAALPETRANKLKLSIQNYLEFGYATHKGLVDNTTMFEPCEINGTDISYSPEVRIMDHITEAERDVWLESGRRGYYKELEDNKGRRSGYHKELEDNNSVPGERLKLTPEAMYVYGFPNGAPDSVTDEMIVQWNAECSPGGVYYDHSPLRDTKNKT